MPSPAYMVTPNGFYAFLNDMPYPVDPDNEQKKLKPGYYDEQYRPMEFVPPKEADLSDLNDYDDLLEKK
jgi:hypothetical protein